MLTWAFLIFLAGASDRVFVTFHLSYGVQIWIYRVLAIVGPPLAAVIAYRVCLGLQASDRVARERRRLLAEEAPREKALR